MAPVTLERQLNASQKLAVRKTVAGGALNTARLAQQLPGTDSWALDFYFLAQPLAKLVNCTDPEVTTVDEWKERVNALLTKYEELGRRLRELAN